eukprot:Skav202589  [mRNA]  locus=scaffold1305:131284:134139:- [translate_table: standard]
MHLHKFPLSRLRDELPRGSLDSLLREFGVERHGTPHTAGSDALATLELYLQVTQDCPKRFRSIAYSEASTNSTTTSFADGTGGSGNYFQGGYSYNYWTEDSQAHHEVSSWDEGYTPSDMPSWEEASFVERGYPSQGAAGQISRNLSSKTVNQRQFGECRLRFDQHLAYAAKQDQFSRLMSQVSSCLYLWQAAMPILVSTRSTGVGWT